QRSTLVSLLYCYWVLFDACRQGLRVISVARNPDRRERAERTTRRVSEAPAHPREGKSILMIPSSLPESVRSQWPYRPRFARVNGWRMHYADEGAGDPVVLLHGNPTWGFLYRDFVGPLTKAGHRVIIPDMIGFGLSEKPTREDAHSLDGHIANL